MVNKKINLIDFLNDTNNELLSSTDGMAKNNLSELQIHKILFLEYGMFYNKFHKELFNPHFEAWKYGPVEVNYRKNINNPMVLTELFSVSLNEEEFKYLKQLSKDLIQISPWTLVDVTHTLDSWIKNYKDGSSHQSINPKDIREDFKNFRFI